MPRLVWTSEKMAALHEHYERGDRELIMRLTKAASWSAVTTKAQKLGLRRSCSKADLSVLLHETPLSYYWIGFIFADGNVVTQKGMINVGISMSDVEHLQKYADYTKSNLRVRRVTDANRPGAKDQAHVTSGDKIVLDQLVTRFGLSNRKTYSPPLFPSNASTDLCISIILGFIDGDGCLSRSSSGLKGYVMCHPSWLGLLTEMRDVVVEHLATSNSIPYINNRGYATWNLNGKQLKSLRSAGERLGLPLLDRKWSLVQC